MANNIKDNQQLVSQSVANGDEIESFATLVRGDTPQDIEEKCLQLCKDYLADNWIKQTVDTIQFRRITGGLSNQLYYCGIAEPEPAVKAPQEVCIRLYGSKWYNNISSDGKERQTDMSSERLSDTITSLLLSEKNLGPKVYGLFENGQIIQYYQNREFNLKDQSDPKLVEELFRKIARVHAMDVPMPKRHWINKELNLYHKEAYSRFPINDLINKYNCKTLQTNDLKAEIEWVGQMVGSVGGPIVFAHNDFSSANILVLNEPDILDNGLIICDYEYSSHGYRGYDLGNILGEWDRDCNVLYFDQTFIDDSVIKQLLYYYINENKRIFGKSWSQSKDNSMDQLLKEIKIGALAYKMFTTLFCLKTDPICDHFPMDKKQLMELAENQCKNYYRLKSQFGYTIKS